VNKKYRVTLTADERRDLEALVHKGKGAARKLTRARILLKADASPEQGPAWSDEQIREALDVGMATICRARQSFVEEGLQLTLQPRPRNRRYDHKLDGDQEAHLIALACSKPPPGRVRWTLRLLAERFVALGHVADVSHETVRQTLKKQVEAAPGEDVVYPAGRQRGVRLAYGGGAVGLQAALRPGLPDGLHG
jgi:transposase